MSMSASELQHYLFAPHPEEEEATANASFGFWIYLMSDCILFASLFATFVTLSRSYAGGPTSQEIIHLGHTLEETLVLLCSSVTCGFAMLAMYRRQLRRVLGWLAVTFVLGLTFISLELQEFLSLVAAGHGPTHSGFLSAFFTLVATHGTHVTVGLLWMLVMMAQIAVKGLSEPVQSRLIRFSMFWHFLDIVWVGVFTVVYLNGVL